MEAASRSQASGSSIATSVVLAFIERLEALDIDGALALLDEDAVYQNVPLPPDRGVEAIGRTLRFMLRFANHFEVEMKHIAETDGVVLTERIDIAYGPLLDMRFWVCGTFEVRNGKIVLWRDYFDLGGFAWKLLTGPMRRMSRRFTG